MVKIFDQRLKWERKPLADNYAGGRQGFTTCGRWDIVMTSQWLYQVIAWFHFEFRRALNNAGRRTVCSDIQYRQFPSAANIEQTSDSENTKFVFSQVVSFLKFCVFAFRMDHPSLFPKSLSDRMRYKRALGTFTQLGSSHLSRTGTASCRQTLLDRFKVSSVQGAVVYWLIEFRLNFHHSGAQTFWVGTVHGEENSKNSISRQNAI